MKSKVLSFAEYDQVDISMYKKVFKLDEKAYKKEIDFIKNKNSIWEETGEVTYGAFFVCNLESENPFFNRENLKIMVGQGFFHKKLEAMCVGLKKGTAGVLDVDGEKVTVTVRSIQQKKSPVITDEMIKDLGIEGVSNVEQYEAHLIREQKKKIAENEGYEAVQYVMDQVFEARISRTLPYRPGIAPSYIRRRLFLRIPAPEDSRRACPMNRSARLRIIHDSLRTASSLQSPLASWFPDSIPVLWRLPSIS